MTPSTSFGHASYFPANRRVPFLAGRERTRTPVFYISPGALFRSFENFGGPANPIEHLCGLHNFKMPDSIDIATRARKSALMKNNTKAGLKAMLQTAGIRPGVKWKKGLLVEYVDELIQKSSLPAPSPAPSPAHSPVHSPGHSSAVSVSPVPPSPLSPPPLLAPPSPPPALSPSHGPPILPSHSAPSTSTSTVPLSMPATHSTYYVVLPQQQFAQSLAQMPFQQISQMSQMSQMPFPPMPFQRIQGPPIQVPSMPQFSPYSRYSPYAQYSQYPQYVKSQLRQVPKYVPVPPRRARATNRPVDEFVNRSPPAPPISVSSPPKVAAPVLSREEFEQLRKNPAEKRQTIREASQNFPKERREDFLYCNKRSTNGFPCGYKAKNADGTCRRHAADKIIPDAVLAARKAKLERNARALVWFTDRPFPKCPACGNEGEGGLAKEPLKTFGILFALCRTCNARIDIGGLLDQSNE